MIPASVLKQHVAIVGKTGSGKTYTARGMVEGLLEQNERVCIIDPTGAWWGLKSSASGKQGAYPVVIFGGDHADVQISGTHGDAIGEVVGTSSTPTIMDTSQLRVGDRTRFFTDFANTLLMKNRGPLHLVIDEAHIFAPQGKVPDPQSGQMLHACNNLVSLGRSRGLRITMITQRPAKLHKDSLTQIETMIALRLIAPQDRKAIEEWISDQADVTEGKKIIASLPSLPTGTGWLWAPELDILKKVNFPKIKTFDSSRAPDAAGMQKIKMAPIDLDKISGKLKSVADEAKAKDPVVLQRQVADLQRQLAAKPQGMGATEITQRALEAEGKGYGKACVEIKRLFKEKMPKIIAAAIDEIIPMTATEINSRKKEADKPLPAPTSHAIFRTEKITVKEAIERFPPPPGELDGPQRKIVRSLQFWKSAGHSSPSKEQVAMVAGYSPTSGSFKNPIGALRSGGYVEYPQPGHIVLMNDAGETIPTTQEARDTLMGVLDGPQKKILGAFNDMDEMTRDECANNSGYSVTSGSFKNPVGALCTLGVLLKTGPGRLKLAEWAKEVLDA